MDLGDIWQEHKRFILTVFGALILLLIGRKVVFMNFEVDRHVRGATKTVSDLGRQTEVRDGQVRQLRDEVDSLRERRTELARFMQFESDDLFVLPVGEPDPAAFCWRRTRDMQKALVDEAGRLDITVPEALGLQDSLPTDLQEVRRTLRALDVIQSVVLACIGAQVRRIGSIQIETLSQKRGASASFVEELTVGFEIIGDEKALCTVIGRLVEARKDGEGPFLQITDPTRITPDKEDPRFLKLELSVSALSLSAEVLDEEAL